jgi:hypothetical protein
MAAGAPGSHQRFSIFKIIFSSQATPNEEYDNIKNILRPGSRRILDLPGQGLTVRHGFALLCQVAVKKVILAL